MTLAAPLTDRYDLLDVLGGSALATTYRARDRSTGGLYVVKVPRAHVLADAAAIGRFRDLLLRVRALRHPNILSIEEVGGLGPDLWTAFEFVEGPTLKDLLPSGINLGPMLGIAAQAAEGLEAAHGAGIVHGDIRPSNIFVLADGTVRLADFGMATLAEGVHPLMRTSLLTPLPAYLAPEIVRGETPGPKGDIYSLGMLLYEVATGQLPFPGYNVETVRVKQEESVILPPTAVNPALPAALNGLLAKALAWSPSDRHATAGALAQDLRALQASLSPTQSTLLIPPEEARSLMEVRPTALPAKEIVVESGSRLCPTCGTPNAATALYCSACWRSLDEVPVLSPEEERSLTLAFRRRARNARLLRRGLLALGVLALLAVIFWDRSAPPGFLAPPPASALSAAPGPGLWTSPRNGAAGTASIRTDGPLPVGKVRWQRDLGAEVASSPAVAKGRLFVTTLDRRILALDVRDGSTVWEVHASGPLDSSPVVAGDKVYVAQRDSTLAALDAADGKTVWTHSLSNPVFTWVVVDQGILYALPLDGTIQTFDAQTGALRWELETPYRFLGPPAVADDRLVVPTTDGRVLVLNGRTGATGLVFLVRRTVEGSAAISGAVAVFGGNERAVRAIDIHARNLPLEKSVLKWWAQFYIWQIAPFPPAQSGTVWSHVMPKPVRSSPAVSGNRVFVTTEDGILYALSFTDGAEVWHVPLEQSKALPGSPIVIDDVVYVGTERGTLHALDAATGNPAWRFQAGGPLTGSPAFADGVLYIVTQNGALYALD